MHSIHWQCRPKIIFPTFEKTVTSRLLLEVRQLKSEQGGPYDFDLMEKECLVVVGPSGSGKSVLLRLLADLDPGAGTVMLRGVDRRRFTGPGWRQKVVYQAAEPAWWAETAREHLTACNADELATLMQTLEIPLQRLDALVTHLSTGERQRLALLRSLAAKPDVLLLDEPTSSLDARSIANVEQLLQQRLDAGMGMVMVTHAPGQASRMGNRVLEMRAGKLTPC